MSEISPGCTVIEKDVLARLIAAARITESVVWIEAEADAKHEVRELWGGRTRDEPASPIEVTTQLLFQLAAAAEAAIFAPHASGSDWILQVAHDVREARDLAGPAGG